MSSPTYVVHRRAISSYGEVVGQNEGSDSVSHVPIRAFATRAAADSHAAELMRVARRTVSPFAVFSYYGDARVRKLKVKFRVKPKDSWTQIEWQRWYETEAPHLTDGQREQVWSLFDDEPLYGVTEVPLGDG